MSSCFKLKLTPTFCVLYYNECVIWIFSYYFAGQLEEIYKVTLARVLCDNLNNMRYIQPNVFYMVSWNQLLNKHTLCSDIPELSLDDWFTT